MMVFPASMKPRALVKNESSPMGFTCKFCGATSDGFVVSPGHGRENWAVLPEDWSEVEDRRLHAKEQFVICCQNSDCRHEAQSHAD